MSCGKCWYPSGRRTIVRTTRNGCAGPGINPRLNLNGSRHALILPTLIILNLGGKMSSSPVPSALDARTQAFPVLTTDQISRVRPGSKIRVVKKGEILFELGNKGVPFFVLPTGELTMVSGRGSLVRGRVSDPGEFLEMDADGLRPLVAKDAALSEILMRAF